MSPLLAACLAVTSAASARAQLPPSEPASPFRADITATSPLAGRPVEAIRVEGNRDTPTSAILAAVRTREGEPYDPLTVQEDYQRVYGLRRFSNVSAKVEPTERGVIVVFTVVEQRPVNQVRFVGNASISDADLRGSVDLRSGESIDGFRIAMARRAVESLYRSKNFSYAHVTVDAEALEQTGDVVFRVVEGPRVYVRNITFVGSQSFSPGALKDEIQTRSWFPIFREGTFNPETVDDDVATIRRFYEQNGFFDAKVGRRVVVSPDQSEVQIDFLIDEGPRYRIGKVTFSGTNARSADDLRAVIKLREGEFYDADVVQRDVKAIVKAYSPLGFIYDDRASDPGYLRITPRTVFSLEPGTIELVYDISEGTPFRVGQILPRGNSRTQDKVILREMRFAPGDLYNSAAVQDAESRLRSSPYFSGASITPVGDDPASRDLVVQVAEAQTATFQIGAGINSNGGIGGNLTYTQRNFDIANFPDSWDDVAQNRAFIGAGQSFRASFEPGTTVTNASVRFVEPWLFDQPYALSLEGYLRTRSREDYTDNRAGGRVNVTRRFDDVWSATVSLRGERVDIDDIDDPAVRSFEILDAEGESVLTTLGLSLRRDTTNRGFVPSEGTNTVIGWESAGALGGDHDFQRYTASWDGYFTLAEDLLDRKTVLALHGDIGWIAGDAPFFERFYGGGIGSLRGFAFRGISPRDGPEDDRIGGQFQAVVSAEVGFPLYTETLRGVVFVDAGTVESDVRIGTIRSAVGAGVRLTLPLLGQVPIAVDFAYPMTKDDDDDTQIISFSLGFIP
jgi:outer membrane protein assembly factor BamA